MGGAGIMSQHIPDDKSRFDLRNLHELRGKTLVAQDDKSRSDIRNLHQLRGKRLVAQVSQTPLFANRSGFDALIGVVLAWEERGSCLNLFRTTKRGRISEAFINYEAKDLLRNMGGAWIMSQHISDDKSRSDLRNLHELRGKRLVGQMSQPRRFAFYLRTRVFLILGLESSWHGRSGDKVSTYFGRKIAVGSQKPSRITRQKTCCPSESNTSVRVVFSNRSCFGCSNWSLLGMGGAWIMSQHIPDDKSRSDLRKNHELRGKRLVTQVSQTRRFALYWRTRVVLMLQLESSWHGRSMDHVSTYSGRQIMVGSQKPSRITRQKACCASESNMSFRVVFANRSGFDAQIGVFLAWEERGSCLNIFRTKNHGRISETITNYEAKDLLRKSVDHVSTYFGRQIAVGSQKRSRITRSVDHVSTYSGRQIAVGSQKPSRITRQKTCCASESNTSIRVVFANRSGFDAPIRVVLAWEERESCVNIFQMTNRGWISETFTNYEAKDLLRNLGMGGAWIMSQHIPDDKLQLDLRNLHELRGKRLVAQVSQIRRFALYSRTRVVMMLQLESSWHGRSVDQERGSCLNIFRMTNRGRISETFTSYEDDKSWSDLRNLHELRGKRLVAQVSQTHRFVLYLRTGVVLMLQLESSWHGRSVNHVSTYSGRQIAVGSQKPSRITRQKTCCASESNKSVRVVFANRSGFDAPIGVVLAWEERGSCLNIFQKTNRFANRSGFDAPIGVVLAWEERGSCLNIFRTTNRGRISETFTNYEATDLLRKSVDHVSTYSRRQIAVGCQKPSRIMRQKTCCASESNTSVRVAFANRSDFDVPIGVVRA
ncbi:uncharacterized protein G2W53_033679 [Senna tora]|uniref:Uncharacterized protein n=1 Tax=Senna tora TaxID=362788 RepID=A0A834W8M1_9FABA|nr:uncharacterized protein G2W53_033679 [Senna tora]